MLHGRSGLDATPVTPCARDRRAWRVLSCSWFHLFGLEALSFVCGARSALRPPTVGLDREKQTTRADE